MILDILEDPNPVLRKTSQPVTTITKKIKKQIKNMIDTMENADGVGLAAPQVGISNRVVIVKNLDTDENIVMINPEIISQSENIVVCEEGCLSKEGKIVGVPRSNSLVVDYLTEKGKQKRVLLEGMSAIITQHEVDHLNGKLIIDYQ